MAVDVHRALRNRRLQVRILPRARVTPYKASGLRLASRFAENRMGVYRLAWACRSTYPTIIPDQPTRADAIVMWWSYYSPYHSSVRAETETDDRDHWPGGTEAPQTEAVAATDTSQYGGAGSNRIG